MPCHTNPDKAGVFLFFVWRLNPWKKGQRKTTESTVEEKRLGSEGFRREERSWRGRRGGGSQRNENVHIWFKKPTDEGGKEGDRVEEEDEETKKDEGRKEVSAIGGGGGGGGGTRRKTGVILHSSGVCLAKSGSSREEDYGITASVVGHVSWRGRHWPCLPSLGK